MEPTDCLCGTPLEPGAECCSRCGRAVGDETYLPEVSPGEPHEYIPDARAYYACIYCGGSEYALSHFPPGTLDSVESDDEEFDPLRGRGRKRVGRDEGAAGDVPSAARPSASSDPPPATPTPTLTDQDLAALRDIAIEEARRSGALDPEREDIAQSVLEKLISQPVVPKNPKAWVRRAAKNMAIDADRKRKGRKADDEGGRQFREVPLDEEDTSDADGREARKADLELRLFLAKAEPTSAAAMRRRAWDQILAKLRERLPQREVDLVMLTELGLSQQEIADRLGYANAATVKVTLARIRKKVIDIERELSDLRQHPRAY